MGALAGLDGVGGLTAPLSLRDASPLARHPDALRGRADEDGYLFLPGLLPRAAVAALARVVLERCAAHGFLADGAPPGEPVAREGIRLGGPDDSRWFAFLADVVPCPEFAALGRSPSLRSIVGALLPAGYRDGRGDILRLVSPDAADLATPPHQDRAYVPGEGPLWTAWVPVLDCPRAAGPLAVLPASHREGLREHARPDSGRAGVELLEGDAFATADLAPGDVVLFSGLTVHAALPNVSRDRLRISADFRFEGAPA